MGSYSRKRYATESASFPKSENSAPGSYSYPTFADLPASGSTPGNTAFVVATNRLYIWSGVGWYLIATVTNASPTAITGVSDTYALAIDGTATTITAVSTDPEGFSLTWSYAVSSGSLGSTATVSQADNVFTITPSTDSAHEGTFSLTFSVTDGLNGVVSAVSSFTLSFSVTNSRYTALSVKAVAAGSNGSFDDASASNHTVTTDTHSTVSITASTFSPYRHGGYATYFDGNDRIDVSTGFLGSHTEGNASTSTFTIESWVYQEARGSNNGIDGNAASIISKWVYFNFGIDDSGHLHGHHYSGAGQHNLETTATVPLKTWTHVALVVTGAQIKLYINGTLGATGTWYGMQSGTSLAGIGGSNQSHPEKFTGYMHDIRVSDNARYTTNFTPADALTTDSNTDLLIGKLQIRDLSSNSQALTLQGDVKVLAFNTSTGDNAPYSEASHGASAHFGNSGAGGIIIPTSAATTSGDYTIEFWIRYNTNKSGSQTLTGVYGQHRIVYSAGRFIDWTSGGTQTYWQTGAGTLYQKEEPGTWTHFAQTRTSGVVKAWINGEGSANTVTDNTSWTTSRFGSEYDTSSENFEGDMADIRITHSAIYTSNFTPPTAPLTTSPTYSALAIGVANSGASAYTLSGDVTGSNATVNMAIGQTVNFTVNASGHPFYIRVSDGGANVSTPAATGQGATSGVVSWTPNTAGTYYYQCGIHAGMIGTINVADGVKFLLNPEPSILDLSQSSEITCFGDAATSTTQVKFAGTKSIYLDGTGDYVQMSNIKDSWISGYAGDYTIEFWWYPTNVSIGNYQEILTAGNGFQFYMFNGGGLSIALSPDNSGNYFWSTTEFHTMVNNTWQHLAFVRNGNVYTIYVDGVSKATTTTSTLFSSGTDPVQLGILGGSLYPTVGYFQDLRITKGLARYTTNFTPPTAELEG